MGLARAEQMFYFRSQMTQVPQSPHAPVIRARATAQNDPSRFDPYRREVLDDGWLDTVEVEAGAPIRTSVRNERARRILTKNQSPDIPFDRSINPYRGCEHGCIYCFARPTHAYLDMSPGLDFETRLIARPNAAEQLARELSAPRYRPAPIAIGTNTDPYQPIERDRGIMRDILQVLNDFNHPVTITTKGALITRDIDILADMATRDLVHVGVSVTTLDPVLSRKMEPRAAAPARRIEVIGRLADAGIPTRVMIAPVVPALTDHELEQILATAVQAGATGANWIMLRLPREVAPLFQDWLNTHYPDRAGRVLGHIRDMHGGALYDSAWGRRMQGQGAYAKLIGARFKRAFTSLGLDQIARPLRVHDFCVPPRVGDQLSLF
jgi:DNA repair photolyase